MYRHAYTILVLLGTASRTLADGARIIQPNNQPRLSAELLATADALRTAIVGVLRLDEANNPAVQYHPATAIVLVDGPSVADALDTLAKRIGVTE